MNASGSCSRRRLARTRSPVRLITPVLQLLLLAAACTPRRPQSAAVPATLAPAAGLPDTGAELSLVSLAVVLPPTFTPVPSPTVDPAASLLSSHVSIERPGVPEATRQAERLSRHPPDGWPAIRGANGPILTYNAALIQDGRYAVGIWAGSGDSDLALPYLRAIAANIVVNP